MPDRDLCGCSLGEFVVRERIDEDSSGAVYRAEQPLLGRDVIIKVLHQQHDADKLKCFKRDAQLVSRLDHPFVAHVYAFGVEDEDGLAWLAQELVDGISLKRWLAKHGPMPLEQVVPFFECIAEAVQTGHDRGIVHSGLTSSNVMVIEGADRLIPKLLDFGLDRLTRSDAGTGRAADIYALGVVAYEALTGYEYDQRHRNAPVPPLGGDFPPALDRIFQRVLAKKPEDRHGTALELASALRAALRTSEPEQLRSAAQHWEDRGRPPGLLWGPDMLAALAQSALVRSAPAQSAPAQSAPAQSAPAQSAPAQSAPAQSAPAQSALAPSRVLGKREFSFLAASQRGARRLRWLRRSLVGLAVTIVVGVVGVFWDRTVREARMAADQADLRTLSAQQLTEAIKTQAYLEQGRSALLHGEPKAPVYLGLAYDRGDQSPSTAFMYSRALQPKLAEQARFASSFGRTWSAAFSPDSRQVVTTDDRGAQVWDAQTYQLLFALPHGDPVYQAVYSADGTQLVTTGGDGAVRIWDAANGALVRELRRGSAKRRYSAVALSSGSKLVAAIDTEGEIADVWDAATGAPIAEVRNDASGFPALAFSSDGRWLATTGGNDVRVYDAQTRAQAITIRGPGIHSLAFDPTGPRLLTGATTGDSAIWAIPSGTRIRHLRDVGEPVDAVAFSPDGQLVVTGSRDGAEQIWHAGSGTLQSQCNPRRSKIFAVEFDRTSTLVLAAGADAIARSNTVEVYELPGDRLLRTIAHGAPVNAVAFANTGRDIVSGAVDGSLLVARDDGAVLVLPRSSGGIDAVAFLPDGRVAAADAQRRLRVYDRGGAVLADLEIPVRVMSLRIDGTRLVAVPIYIGNAAPPLLVDVERYRVVAQLEGHVGRVVSARWVAGHQILTAGSDGTARLWDGSTGQLRQIYQGGSGALADATLAPDGLVMAGGADGLLRFWDAASGRLLWALQAHKSPLIGVHVEGRDIVTRGFGGELSRWTLPRSEQVIEACGGQERCAIMHP